MMTKSKVYFSDRQAQNYYNMLDKLAHVFEELGLREAIKPGQRVMIKTHFGNWGNTNYIRPAYVRKLVDLVYQVGGFPFVAESCGLGYSISGIYGGRTTAVDYLENAARNGFTRATVGAPIILADGYWGVDTFDIEIEGEYVKNVPVASAVLDSDIIIVLTHAKGHGLSGIGGSIKNVGIGLVGKRGKSEMHTLGDMEIDSEKCLGPECSECLKVCPTRCIEMKDKAVIDLDRCIRCLHCRSICARKVKAQAITVTWRPIIEQSPRFVENALGVIKSIGAEKFYFINLAIDISDKCDCWNVGAPLLVHDIGIFGSQDILAVDQASFDAINNTAPNPNSMVDGIEIGEDKFAMAHNHKDETTGELIHVAEIQFSHAEKIGLGSRDYELITLTKETPKRE
jgi:uncharacterized Fe-S center protein